MNDTPKTDLAADFERRMTEGGRIDPRCGCEVSVVELAVKVFTDTVAAPLRADALNNRKDFVERYCTRRVDHREGDFTYEQLATWEQEAATQWAEKYPALASLVAGSAGEVTTR